MNADGFSVAGNELATKQTTTEQNVNLTASTSMCLITK